MVRSQSSRVKLWRKSRFSMKGFIGSVYTVLKCLCLIILAATFAKPFHLLRGVVPKNIEPKFQTFPFCKCVVAAFLDSSTGSEKKDLKEFSVHEQFEIFIVLSKGKTRRPATTGIFTAFPFF